jgi:hypothetical protein
LVEESSPEISMEPYEGLDDLQQKISGEKLPELVLEVCNDCYWTCTCFNQKGKHMQCPICNCKIAYIPMKLDEIAVVDYSEDFGLKLDFKRQLPMR